MEDDDLAARVKAMAGGMTTEQFAEWQQRLAEVFRKAAWSLRDFRPPARFEWPSDDQP